MSTTAPAQGPALLRHPWKHLLLQWDDELSMLVVRMNIRPVQCYSLAALRELLALAEMLEHERAAVRHVVLASAVEGVFNFGGDLALFVLLARSKDKRSLVMYGQMCLALVCWLESAPRLGIHTWALVEGDALGGGLESALPAQRIVANRSAEMGYPEVLFNLFPGMGAWPFTAKRAGNALAQEMVLTGKVYRAEELHVRGLVETVVEPGAGLEVIRREASAMASRHRGIVSALAARLNHQQVPRQALDATIEDWADAALGLTDRDLRLMDRLVRAQLKKVGGVQADGAVEEIKRMELEEALAASSSA